MFFPESFVPFVQEYGYFAIVALMFLESSFFPFPSEVVIPPAAYLSFKGLLDINLVVISGVIGSLLGAVFNYYMALFLGRPFFKKYGKFFLFTEHNMKRVELFFEKHGSISTFIGRLLPGIRQYISLPAGLAKMNFFAFCFYTFLGAGIWVVILAVIGYSVGYKEDIIRSRLNEILTYIAISAALLIGLYILFKKKGLKLFK